MKHILDIRSELPRLHDLFRNLKEGNTVLFLGAGASVGAKRYLSRDFIELYEAEIHKTIGETNITRFVDILSADPNFRRSEFDSFVTRVLQKLTLGEGHRTIATIPWREIITTNFDLLLERAYDEVRSESHSPFELKVIRNRKQMSYMPSNTEVKYIKLHGCIQDASQYPLAFSTTDFENLKPFYKEVLNPLKNLSPAITFLSIGYSYTDEFGRTLIEKFDSYNFREKKWLISVDPFPNENALEYYSQQRICIIKCSFEDFFGLYREWDLSKASAEVTRKGLVVTDSKHRRMPLSPKLLLDLDGVVKQLSIDAKDRHINDVDYYRGEEPTFQLITRGVDVIKSKAERDFIRYITEKLQNETNSFIPIFFLTGDFGIGKSTFALRTIFELQKLDDWDLVAFEIIDFNRMNVARIAQLVKNSQAKNVAFVCDAVEVDSHFRELLHLQRELSIEQFQNKCVFIIAPIRENILQRTKLDLHLHHCHEFRLDGKFQGEEVEELIEKLRKAGLVQFRDAFEKQRIMKTIVKDYRSDSFISLMAIVTNGQHEQDLIQAYNQLSQDARKAFLCTALIHRFQLLIPSSWLKQSISMNWEEFTTRVIKAEGRGILIQEITKTQGAEPDLFFRTKHPLIAEKLIERFLSGKDRQYQEYNSILSRIEPGPTSSNLAINLLKAIGKAQILSDSQIAKLYDAAYTRLPDDPYFLLHYSINLQHRKTKTDLKKGVKLLVYAESLLERRSDRFTHRRGAIHFELARLYYDKEKNLSTSKYHLDESRQLLEIKQKLDPFSSFSYFDLMKLLIWELKNFGLERDRELEIRIQIDELFELAQRLVESEIDRIEGLYFSYKSEAILHEFDQEYEAYLEKMYLDAKLRPLSCILMYNYCVSRGDSTKAIQMLEEVEQYSENQEVVKFLFKIYGRELYIAESREKLLRLAETNSILEESNPLRYYYFMFVANSYNFQWKEGKRYQKFIKSRYASVTAEYHQIWMDKNSEPKAFDAVIIKSTGKSKAVKLVQTQWEVQLQKGNYEEYPVGSKVEVRLHFFIFGMLAEIVGPDDRE